MCTTTVRTVRALEAFIDCGPYTAPLDQLGVTCSDVRTTSSRVLQALLLLLYKTF